MAARSYARYFLYVAFVFILSGCTVRTYSLTRDRVDQDLAAGNRGYIQGQMPSLEERDRKKTRTTRVVEIELGRGKDESVQGSKGTASEPVAQVSDEYVEEDQSKAADPRVIYQQYTVQKNDTLQKISQKFYGTTKKWQKIYEANKDILKGANKIYPGQVINIPVSGSERTKYLK